MKKCFPVISFLLLVSFISVDTTAQRPIDHMPQELWRMYYIDRIDIEQKQTRRNRDIEEKLSETICNSSWLAEATGEDVQSELVDFDNSLVNWMLSSNIIKEDLRDFIASNNPCSAETGVPQRRPLALASDAGAAPEVIDMLIAFGAEFEAEAEAEADRRRVVPSFSSDDCPFNTKKVYGRYGAAFCQPID